MTFLARAIVLAVFALSAISLAAQSQTPPTFRTRADAVTVNVSVQRGNRPVEGLNASDFTLLDNGVPQTVVTTSMGEIPLDATLVYGVGLWSSGNVRQFRTDAGRMASLLGPTDRLRVLEYGPRVLEVFPLQPIRGELVSAHLDQFRASATSITGGWTALYDALVAALILPTSPERRQLVVAFYDGYDTISVTSPARLQAVAARTEAVLHVQLFQRTVPTIVRGVLGPFPFYLNGLSDPDEDQIVTVAQTTGGGAYGAGLLGRSMVEFFTNVLTDYRRGYVLQYTPSAVASEGWHEIDVKVTKPGKYDVRARRGYFVDAVSR
jgi:VWFA-related protein